MKNICTAIMFGVLNASLINGAALVCKSADSADSKHQKAMLADQAPVGKKNPLSRLQERNGFFMGLLDIHPDIVRSLNEDSMRTIPSYCAVMQAIMGVGYQDEAIKRIAKSYIVGPHAISKCEVGELCFQKAREFPHVEIIDICQDGFVKSKIYYSHLDGHEKVMALLEKGIERNKRLRQQAEARKAKEKEEERLWQADLDKMKNAVAELKRNRLKDKKGSQEAEDTQALKVTKIVEKEICEQRKRLHYMPGASKTRAMRRMQKSTKN